MEKGIDYHFSRGLTALEELKVLASPDLCPFVDVAIHYVMTFMEEILRQKGKDLKKFDSLCRLIKNRIEECFKETLKINANLNCLNISYEMDNLSLQGLDRVIDCLRPLLELLGILQFKKRLNVRILEDGIEICGNLDRESWEDDFKDKVYKITKIFLSKKTLLTYKVLESGEVDFYQLYLKVDFSHNDNEFYCLDFKETFGLVLGFSGAFKNYHLAADAFSRLGQHDCVEIKDNLTVEKYKKIPYELNELNTLYSNYKTILHFSFLFKPISLILPMRGNLIPLETLEGGLSIENEEKIKIKIEKKFVRQKYSFHYLDLFSFICS